jgi:hypothetical protein
MTPSEKYRHLAAECIRIAREGTSTADRALLIAMAESWVRLAEQVELREAETASSAPHDTGRSRKARR